MDYKKLGHTDLIISSLGFGAMRLPIPPDSGDYKEAIKLIHHAADKGINFFDVGKFYCHFQCEAAFGQAIKGTSNEIIISGKNSSHQSIHENWTGQLYDTLHHFGQKTLDLYFIHYLNQKVWEEHFMQERIINQIYSAKNEGLIKYLGFSSHDSPENIRKLIDLQLFDAIILSYNFVNRTYEDTIQYANKKGMGVIIMNPLAGGILNDSTLDLHEITDHMGKEITAVALNYVLSNPYVHCVMSGMRSTKEIDNNIQTTENRRFSTEEIEFINSVITRRRDEKMIYCTACNYCLPCPQGINVPEVIKIWNLYNFIKGDNHFNRDYQMLDVTADCCIKCGICEERCPNAIGIIGIMEKVAKLLS